MVNYSRYSHHARRALTHAALLVTRFHHPRTDTAHLLVGVMLTSGSIGCNVLQELGLHPDSAMSRLQSLTLPLVRSSEQVVNDAALDLALEMAADEANWLGHHYVGTEHLLLGITRTNLGNASDLLRLMQVSPDRVRRRVRRAVKAGETEFSLQFIRRLARFSEIARRVLVGAEQLSVNLDHPTVGLGHLLVALLSEQRGKATRILREGGLDAGVLERDLRNTSSNLLLISVEAVLNEALELSEQQNQHYTGTEHLILALCQNSTSAQLLRAYGIQPEILRHRVTGQT
jgi:ATP-dependent Clp protease ATP-binding subunit ClpA